jgi:putative transposase
VRYAFIARHRAVWPTRTMCRVLRASPSGFYDWLERSPCKRVRDDERLLGMIRTSFQGSDRTYGSPRIGTICAPGASAAARSAWRG